MKEYLSTLETWSQSQKPFALARVMHTWGSSPRPVGSCLLIDEEGNMVGSVSGGCVEGAVVKACEGVLAEGKAQLLEYGVSDEEAWTVGLSCGGRVEVLLQPIITANQPLPSFWHTFLQALEQDEPCTWVTLIQNEIPQDTLIREDGSTLGASSPPKCSPKPNKPTSSALTALLKSITSRISFTCSLANPSC